MVDLMVLSISRDIAGRKKTERRLEQLSLQDELTGLKNRRGFYVLLPEQGKRARRSGARVVVLYGDVDDFKAINDTRGHTRGDDVLKALAEALRVAFRETDLIARLGGDEFCVVAESPSEPAVLVQRLDEAIAAAGEELGLPRHAQLRHGGHRLARPRGSRRAAHARRHADVRGEARAASARARGAAGGAAGGAGPRGVSPARQESAARPPADPGHGQEVAAPARLIPRGHKLDEAHLEGVFPSQTGAKSNPLSSSQSFRTTQLILMGLKPRAVARSRPARTFAEVVEAGEFPVTVRPQGSRPRSRWRKPVAKGPGPDSARRTAVGGEATSSIPGTWWRRRMTKAPPGAPGARRRWPGALRPTPAATPARRSSLFVAQDLRGAGFRQSPQGEQ